MDLAAAFSASKLGRFVRLQIYLMYLKRKIVFSEPNFKRASVSLCRNILGLSKITMAGFKCMAVIVILAPQTLSNEVTPQTQSITELLK